MFIEETQVFNSLTLDYFADWPSVEYTVKDDKTTAITIDDIYVPRWSLQPLLHLTAAYCLDPQCNPRRRWTATTTSRSPAARRIMNSARKPRRVNMRGGTTICSANIPPQVALV